MPNGEAGHLHPERTARSQFQYFFYEKHHGGGDPRVSQWAPDVTENAEFGIFDQADALELFDHKGNLYGARRSAAADELLILGTLGQQVAKFPNARPNEPWHGYPLRPIKANGDVQPPDRPVPKEALQRMVDTGVLSRSEMSRIRKGKV